MKKKTLNASALHSKYRFDAQVIVFPLMFCDDFIIHKNAIYINKHITKRFIDESTRKCK